jgi:iron(III) transport system ATP-binding protein
MTANGATSQVDVLLEGVSRSFGSVRAVQDVDLQVPHGSVCALLGPSGCGKTTLLRLVAGFERPDAGSIRIGSVEVAGPRKDLPAERRNVGMVFQDYALFPHMDVAGNVGYGLDRAGRARRTEAVLDLVGLAGFGDRSVHELSGGQQQRVALARALAPQPRVILLDEPFSNLDASLRDRLRREMRDILSAAEVTALFVTHDQDEALSIADVVAVMRDGRIVQTGTPEEVYTRPSTGWVADFLGETLRFRGASRGGRVEFVLASLPIDAGFEGPAEVLVRPESIGLTSGARPAEADARRGVVVGRQYYGHDQLVDVRLDGDVVVQSRLPGFPAFHPGDSVWAWVSGPVSVIAAEEL